MIKISNLNLLGYTLRSSLTVSAKFYSSTSQNEVQVNSNYENKNPRNLEWSGHQYKRFGWNLQYPPKDFYHQCVFRNLPNCLDAYVEHSSGKKVVHMITDDPAIRQHLYSSRDLSAAKNLARIFADRCLQFGLNEMRYLKSQSFESSPKEQLFYKTLIECGLKLEEPEFIERPDEMPGLDLDKKDFHHQKLNKPFPPELD